MLKLGLTSVVVLLTLALTVATSDVWADPWVNVTMDGVSDANEESPGGYLAHNNDDDDSDSVTDVNDTNGVTGEDNLVRITLDYGDTNNVGYIGLGGTNVRFWTSASKTTEVPAQRWYLARGQTPPHELWVEGVTVSSAGRDAEIKMSYIREGYPSYETYDYVKLTIVTVQVNELGFVSDHKIKLWPSGTTVDPNDDAPIWKRTNNPNHPVCYTKNTAPSMFGKFGVTPSISPDKTGIRVRAKVSTITIGSASNLKLSGTAVEDANNTDGDVDGIAGGSPVPDSNGVKTLTPNMKWEWSIDDGTSWASAGSISTIKMHYTEATPLDVDDLYDLALDKACAYVNGDADICGKISAGIDDDVWYDPGSPACNHTLDIYNTPSAGYMCCCHALLFPRLTRAIGVDAAAKYLWGGHSATQACWFLVGTGGAATFRITRPSHEGSTEANPHFNWHAEVVSSGTYYDPSYGTTGLPSVSEMAPAHTPFAAAALQVDSQKFTTSHGSGWTCPH